jgi:hypothetical protein
MSKEHQHGRIRRYGKSIDKIFFSFEAIMHIYLAVYLISIGANIPVILFTLFELSMFIRQLFRKELTPP